MFLICSEISVMFLCGISGMNLFHVAQYIACSVLECTVKVLHM